MAGEGGGDRSKAVTFFSALADINIVNSHFHWVKIWWNDMKKYTTVHIAEAFISSEKESGEERLNINARRVIAGFNWIERNKLLIILSWHICVGHLYVRWHTKNRSALERHTIVFRTGGRNFPTAQISRENTVRDFVGFLWWMENIFEWGGMTERYLFSTALIT